MQRRTVTGISTCLRTIKGARCAAILSAVAAAGLGSTAFAQNNHFTNGSGDLTWENAANWDSGVPSFSDGTVTIDSGFNVNAASSSDTANNLVIGSEPNANGWAAVGGVGSLTIETGSTVTANGFIVAGFGADSGVANYSGTINVNTGGTLVENNGNPIYVGYANVTNASDQTVGTLNISGGTASFNTGGVLFLGSPVNNGVVTGVMNVGAGGTGGIVIAQGVQVGSGGSYGVLNLSSGSFNSTYYLTTGAGSSSGRGIINVFPGATLNASQLTVCEGSDQESDFNQLGGTVNVNGPVRIGRSGNNTIAGGDVGVMNLSGGAFNDNDANDDFQLANSNTDGVARLNISGTAQLSLNIGIFGLNLGTVGGGNSVVTQTGGSLTINPQSNLGLFFGPAQGAQQTFNLSGGTFTVPQITAMGQVDGQVWTGGGLDNGLSIKQTLLLNGGMLVANNNMTVPEISGTHSVTFTAPTAFYTYIGPAGFNINTSANTVTWNNNLSPAPGVTADGGLTKTGAGTMVLSGSNTFNGPITISSGTLDATQTASLPGYATTGQISIATGATLGLGFGGSNQFAASDVANILTTQSFAAGSSIGLDTSNSSGGATYTSNLTDTSNGSLGLVKLGSNTLYLSGSNTYTGGTNISNGTLSLQSTGALGTTGPIIFGSEEPFLQFSSSNTTDYSSRFTTAPNQSFGFDTNGQNVTVSNSLNSSGGYLNKYGSGTLTLQGSANSVKGFQVNGGTLELSGTLTTSGGNYIYIGNGGTNSGVSGDSGTLILDSGATLNINGSLPDSFVLGRDSGSGTLIQQAGSTLNYNPSTHNALIVDASAFTNSVGTYTMNGGTLNMNGNAMYVGLLQGQGYLNVGPGSVINNLGGLTIGISGGGETGTVIQTGGTINLNGSSPVIIANGTADTGNYTITGGTLATPAILSYGNTFNNNSTLTLGGGTIQATQDSPAFINGLNNAIVTSTPTTIDNNSHNITIGQNLTDGGGGSLIFAGTGTTRLIGANTYSGNTTVTAGSVFVGNPSAIGSGTAMLSGGATLALGVNAASQLNLNSFQPNGTGGFTPTVTSDGRTAELTQEIAGAQESLLSGTTIAISDATGFSASFIYTHAKIAGQGGAADGVTFVLVGSAAGNGQFGGGGGDDGYAGAGDGFDPAANGGADSIAADIDEYNDRIGVGVNGVFTGQTAAGSVPISEDSGEKVDINYSYNTSSGTGTFTETLTSLSNGSTYTYSTPNVDLAQMLGGTAGGTANVYFGFTGATGGVNDIQNVSALAFSSSSGGVPLAGVVVSNPVTVADGASATVQLAATPGYSSGGVGPITIGNGSVLNVSIGANAATGVLRGVLTTPSVTFTNPSSGQLNIGPNALDLTSQSLASVNAMVASGYAGGTWNGSGIVSSSAANDSTHLTAVGVIQNNQNGTPLYTTFDGTAVGATDILVKDTYYGDTNLDGQVDGTDYSRIDNGALMGLTGWFNGDFNYDGVIDGSDYTLIDNAYNTQGASLAAAVATAEVAGSASGSSVPEPTTLGLIGIGAAGILGRRRRR